MLQLHGSAALKGRDIAVGGKPHGVPEAHWRLHAQLALEGLKRDLGKSDISKQATTTPEDQPDRPRPKLSRPLCVWVL